MITFPLHQPQTTAALTYLPFGTTTIRFVVRSDQPLPPLLIRPLCFLAAEVEKGLFVAHEDEAQNPVSAHFAVSWGGGQEKGLPAYSEDRLGAFETNVAVPAGGQKTLMFNLTHLSGQAISSTPLTFIAFEEAQPERIVARLVLTLQAPAGVLPTPHLLRQTRPGEWEVRPGTHLPSYQGRWQPGAVSYKPAAVPPLTLRHQTEQATLLVQWQGRTIAQIEDHTTPSIFDLDHITADVFEFDDYYVALRLWFFWLDINIGHGFFIGRHEIPDVERFDFLILKSTGQIRLACTDFHWRESWGVAYEEPVRATIGLSTETKIKMAQSTLSTLWQKLWGSKPAASVYDPLPFVRKLAKREAVSGPLVVRQKGTEAHVPMLQNVDSSQEALTSSDVRLV